MGFPIDDWQFWAVTLVAIGVLLFTLRMLIPRRRGTRVELTIGRNARSGKGKGTSCH